MKLNATPAPMSPFSAHFFAEIRHTAPTKHFFAIQAWQGV